MTTTTPTTDSNRFDAARAALTAWDALPAKGDATTTRAKIDAARGVASALRALLEPAGPLETPEEIADRVQKVTHEFDRIGGLYEAALKGARAGVEAAHAAWATPAAAGPLEGDTLTMVSDLVDTAGHGIAYWASAAHVEEDAQTYEVTPDAEADREAQTLTFAAIHAALLVLSTPAGGVRRDIRERIAIALAAPGEADLDAEVADVAIQQAMFGEIVFG